MSNQLQVTGEAKIRDIQGPVVANSGVITALDGDANQYVRGDGTLADFPTSTGGGSSVSYYLNSSVSQGTIGGNAYRELSKEPIIGAGTDIAISSNGYIANYITDANDPDVILIPGGNFNCEFYFSVNNNTGNPFFYAELYKYDGTTFTLLGSSVGVPEYINQGTTINPYYFAIPVATATLALTDRLAIRIYVNVDGRTVTLHTENSHLCQVVTTLSKGMVSLNNLTDQSQFITTGTSGTDFTINSTGDTHTFNLPIASATNTGKLSSTDWTTFNNKQPAGNYVTLDTTQTITGQKTFSTTLFGTDAEFSSSILSPIVSILDSSTYTKVVRLQTLAATNRDVYFPDLNGTVTLLEGSQTFTGDKTFNGSVDFNNSAYLNAGVFFRNNAVGSTLYTNFSILKSGNLETLTYLFPTANSSRLVFNDAATYTYTFPAASGTLALSSDLSSYVPYTGATGNVNLGTNEITASNFVAETSFSAKLLTSGTPFRNGYTTFSAATDAFCITQAISAGNLKSIFYDLSNLVNNTSYTYGLPAASGTFALLESTQSFSGSKTFTGAVSFNNSLGSSPIVNRGFAFVKGNTPSATSTSWSQIYAASGDNNIIIADTNNTSKLQFQASGTYTYTFPATTGTVALTSSLSSYVPYSGATTDVDLGAYFLTANYIKSGDIVFWKGTGTGLGNIGLGRIVPLGNNTTGQLNIGIGENALFNNTTGSNNIAIGATSSTTNTTGSSNIGIGSSANRLNVTGSSNIAIGVGTLYSNTVNFNIAIGSLALYTNTTGTQNIAIGHNSQTLNSTGNNNTSLGYLSLSANTTGGSNTAIGNGALQSNTTGGNNVAIGNVALSTNTTSSGNTAIGGSSLAISTGSFNTAVGLSTLSSNTTGQGNVGIGYGAGSNITTGNNNTLIGAHLGTATMSNNIILSDGQANARFWWDGTNTNIGQSGNVGIGNASPSYKLDVTGTGRFTSALTIGGSVTSASQFIGSNTITDPVAATTTASVLALNGQSAGNNFGIGVGAIRNSAYDMWFQTGASNGGGYRWYIGTTERMTMSSTGNVGIGTSSPSQKLVVVGGNGNQLTLDNTGQTYTQQFWKINGSDVGTIWASTSEFHMYTYGTQNILFSTNNTERMRITSGGDISFNGGSGSGQSSTATPKNFRFNNDYSNGYTDASLKLYLFNSGATIQGLGSGPAYDLQYHSSGSSSGSHVWYVGNNQVMKIATTSGNLTVLGSLSKGSGSFRIEHPLESMKDTHQLVHSFVESPQANNIYRGKVQLINGKAEVNLDEVSTMTQGTFVLLNREIHTYTSNETDWDAVRGNVEGNVLYIECQNNKSNAMVSWLVIGERQDKHMMDTDWTDENGKVIVEPLKEITPLENKNLNL